MDASISKEIDDILLSNPIDLESLRKFSRQPGGFQSNELRRRVWPKLLGINKYEDIDFISLVKPHRDDNQIACDIERSLWSIDVTLTWDETLREKRRGVLMNIIKAILCQNSNLSYFQGYHDILSVLSLVMENDSLTYQIAEHLSRSHISDFMGKDFETLVKILPIVTMVIEHEDKELYEFMSRCSLEPYFSTSWIITWFSHDVKALTHIARVFDALLASPPYYIIYLCAALVLDYRDEVMALECDFAVVHSFLTRLASRGGRTGDHGHQKGDQTGGSSTSTSPSPNPNPNPNLNPFEHLIARADLLMGSVVPGTWLPKVHKDLRRDIEKDRVCMFRSLSASGVKRDLGGGVISNRCLSRPDWALLVDYQRGIFTDLMKRRSKVRVSDVGGFGVKVRVSSSDYDYDSSDDRMMVAKGCQGGRNIGSDSNPNLNHNPNSIPIPSYNHKSSWIGYLRQRVWRSRVSPLPGDDSCPDGRSGNTTGNTTGNNGNHGSANGESGKASGSWLARGLLPLLVLGGLVSCGVSLSMMFAQQGSLDSLHREL